MLSGLAGLVYEVVWARQLVLIFGNTTQAISAILTGFFGGMALGSALGGALADRVKSPLRMYAILELLVVAAVLSSQVWFGGLHEIYRGAFGTLQDNPTMLGLVRFALALIGLGPATVIMGATLPTLTRFMVRSHLDLGHEFGELYFANTAGAIYGAALSGFVLIEVIGLRATLIVGAAFSATAAVVALLLSRRTGLAADEPAAATSEPAADAPAAGERSARQEAGSGLKPRPRLALALAFVSGLTSLGYQTLWNRMLSSGTGGRTYIFTAILVIFLIGIAVGAYLFTRWLHKSRQPVAVLGVAELALAILILGTLGIETDVLGIGVLVPGLLLVVAPATLVMGIVFPMSSMLVGDSDERVGTSAGLLLAVNTVGSICGTFVLPFFLMPLLTSARSVVVLAGINAITGLVLLWQAGLVRRPQIWAGRAVGSLASVAAVVLLIVPNSFVADRIINQAARNGSTVMGQAEDEVAAVQAVTLPDGLPMLYVGGYGMTTITVTTRMMAYLPLMARPQSTELCNIALGMGSTYRSGLIAGLRVDAVELVPTVPDMLDHFYPDIRALESGGRGQIYVADGRNYLQLTDERYDLVAVDPPPPMDSSGTGVLFSQEFYKAARGVLRPGGIMMQWVFGEVRPDELRNHVRTYASVFKHVLLSFGTGDVPGVLMLGSDEPISLTAEGIRSVLSRPGVVADLNSAPDSPPNVKTLDQWQAKVLADRWLDDAGSRAFAGDGPIITDDRPFTEYDLLRLLTSGSGAGGVTRAELLRIAPTSFR